MSSEATLAQRELAAKVGISVFLASWAMVFVALLFAHLLLDSQSIADDPSLPLGLASLNTGVLVLSSALARVRRPSWAALSAASAGLLFVGLQVVLWSEMWASGLWPTDSQLASSLYALTGFHAVHVVVGIGGLVWAGLARPDGLRWWRIYWDFVALAWLAIFVVGFAT